MTISDIRSHCMAPPPVVAKNLSKANLSRNHRQASQATEQVYDCIHLIARAYKATLTSTVETEVFIPPLDLHLNSVVARVVKKMAENSMA